MQDSYLGIDIGTSGVKCIVINDSQAILDQQTVSLPISRPQDLWSEQNPADWWNATCEALDALKKRNPDNLKAVRSIGLTGQMHGAVLLNGKGDVLRPAILWNDNRSGEECAWLEKHCPQIRTITGNIVMPGFTAPKLLWVQKHEPDIFAATAKILLPKDYIRYLFTGAFISDMSDSAGTLWLDVAKRQWSDIVLSACSLNKTHMPELCEGSDTAGTIKAELCERWGFSKDVSFAGGAGDNAAGAIGIGATRDNRAFISLGTSGVYFIGTNDYKACPEKTVHSFCHALPDTWHQMGVILSAASCIKSAATFLLHDESDKAGTRFNLDSFNTDNKVVFLPYLSGERTPHNDPFATGAFVGLTHDTTRHDMMQAVLEGVAFAFADCQDALAAAGSTASELAVIGGGSRNKLWGKILATVLGKTLVYYKDADQGPAFGAARLAQISKNPKNVNMLLDPPEKLENVEPFKAWYTHLNGRLVQYRDLYNGLKSVRG